ncbi:thermonuclease family protein [Mycolicibacterium fortuitum]|uniref:thermonuclease family protein n=1 Tax=Mycolicibacterium fortuitum TaxID=1766 RepID=UPI001CE0748F|nr:thermonuclease family protein [Mycolicibacterium fortuitum]MCA4726664.1 thermonuclease family protein [Mycolicibacterium fortuitum]
MPTDNVEGPYPVTKVVDGDTIWVDRHGVRAKVRLTGLDTPEVRDPRKPVQCFGVEASEHAKQLLAGQQVYLERDPGQDSIDKYGRELAYVWTTSGALINLVMIAEGFGHEYTYDLPYKYQPQFRAAQAEARAGGRGLWSASTCAGDTRAVRDGGMR